MRIPVYNSETKVPQVDPVLAPRGMGDDLSGIASEARQTTRMGQNMVASLANSVAQMPVIDTASMWAKVGAAGMDAANKLGDVFKRIQLQNDTAKMIKADTAAHQELMDWYVNDGMQRQGWDAQTLMQDTQSKATEIYNKHLSTVPESMQAAWSERFFNTSKPFIMQAAHHQLTETDNAKKDLAKNMIVQAGVAVGQAGGDIGTIRNIIQGGEDYYRGLFPGKEVGAEVEKFKQGVIDKAANVYLMGQNKDFKSAFALLENFKDYVAPETLVRVNNAYDSWQTKQISLSEKAERQAEKALRQQQEDNAFNIWKDAQALGPQAKDKYSLDYLSGLQKRQILNANETKQLYNLVSGLEVKSDREVIETLQGDLADGKLKKETIDYYKESGLLTPGDTNKWNNILRKSNVNSPDTKLVLKQVEDLVDEPLANKNGGEDKERNDTNKMSARQLVIDRIMEGKTPDEARAEALLKYAPGLKDGAAVGVNKLGIKLVPDTVEELQPYWDKLYQLGKTGELNPSQWKSQYNKLMGVYDLVGKRKQLHNILNQSKGK